MLFSGFCCAVKMGFHAKMIVPLLALMSLFLLWKKMSWCFRFPQKKESHSGLEWSSCLDELCNSEGVSTWPSCFAHGNIWRNKSWKYLKALHFSNISSTSLDTFACHIQCNCLCHVLSSIAGKLMSLNPMQSVWFSRNKCCFWHYRSHLLMHSLYLLNDHPIWNQFIGQKVCNLWL